MMDVNLAVTGCELEIKGVVTFAGILNSQYSIIGKKWKSETVIDRYMKDYRYKVLPHFRDRPLKDYSLQYCENVITELEKKYPKGSKGHYRLLIRKVFDRAAEIGEIRFPLWGTIFDSKQSYSLVEKVRNSIKKLVKFFSVQQEFLINDLIFQDPEQDGYRMGLLIMYLTGARNLEAAAISVNDLVIKNGKPFLVIINSIEELSAKAKAGTKTKNGYRYFPISWKLYHFLMKRKAWLAAKIASGEIEFQPGSEFQKLGDLPFACDGENWTQYCTPSKLTDAGRELFKKIKITAEEMQILNEDMALNENEVIFGRFKDATAYAMRRNMAGHLSDCGCNIYEARYLFGHVLDYGEIQRHHFVNDDEMLIMHKLLSNRPLANEIDFDGLSINFCQDEMPLQDVFRVKGLIETSGREGQVLVIEILPRESHVVTEVSFRNDTDDKETRLRGVYVQKDHKVNDHTGRIIVPRYMLALYDYWRPYAEEEKRRQ